MLAYATAPAPAASSEVDRLRVGQAALEDGQYRYAEIQFRTALKKANTASERVDAVLALAQALRGQGAYDAALAFLEAHSEDIETSGRADQALLLQASLRMDAKQFDEALSALDQLVDAQVQDDVPMKALRLRGRILMNAGRFQEAEGVLSAFAQRYPDNDLRNENILDLSSVLFQAGETNRATQVLETYLKEHEDEQLPNIRLQLASYYVASKQQSVDVLRPLLLPDADVPADIHARAALLQARLLMNSERPENALNVLKQLDETSLPETLLADIQSTRIDILFQLSRIEEAVALSRETVRSTTDQDRRISLQLMLADQLLARNRFEEALQEYQNFLEAFADQPGYAQALMGRAWALYELGRHLEAAAAFEKAAPLQQTPKSKYEAQLKAADAYFAEGLYRAARERYLLLPLEFSGTDYAPQALYQAAECLARLGEYDAALKEYIAVEDAFSGTKIAERAVLSQALLEEDRGAYPRAIKVYEHYLEKYPEGLFRDRAIHGRGLIRYRLGLFQEALDDFNSVVQSNQSNRFGRQAFYMRGWCLYLLGRDEEALAVCDDFITRYPGSVWAPDVLFWIAEYHFNHGRPAAAEQHFLKLAENYPDSTLADDALYWAGRAAARVKEYLRAIDHFNQLSSDYPKSDLLPRARFAQGDVLSELGRFDGAILAFEEIIEKQPGTYLAGLARGRKGDCQFTLGAEDPARYEDAMASYQTVLDDSGSGRAMRQQALYKTGRCLEKLGRREEALQKYLDVVYGFFEEGESGSGGEPLWFTRAAFGAATLLEQDRQWSKAVQIYQRVVASGVPAEAEARKKIKRIRLEHWLLF